MLWNRDLSSWWVDVNKRSTVRKWPTTESGYGYPWLNGSMVDLLVETWGRSFDQRETSCWHSKYLFFTRGLWWEHITIRTIHQLPMLSLFEVDDWQMLLWSIWGNSPHSCIFINGGSEPNLMVSPHHRVWWSSKVHGFSTIWGQFWQGNRLARLNYREILVSTMLFVFFSPVPLSNVSCTTLRIS